MAGLAGPGAGGGGRLRLPHPAPHRRPSRRRPVVVFEDLPGDLDDPLGPEVEGWLDRVDWLREHTRRRGAAGGPADRGAVGAAGDLRRTRRGGLDGGGLRGGPAGRPAVAPRGRRSRPPRCWPGARGCCRSSELVELLSFAHDRPTDELVAATLPAVREFVRHGVLVPAGERLGEGGGRAGEPGRRYAWTARSSAEIDRAGAAGAARRAPRRQPRRRARRWPASCTSCASWPDERSCAELDAPLLVVSQFTLYGDTRKGRRPSWSAAARPEQAEPLVEAVVAALRERGARWPRGCSAPRWTSSR